MSNGFPDASELLCNLLNALGHLESFSVELVQIISSLLTFALPREDVLEEEKN